MVNILHLKFHFELPKQFWFWVSKINNAWSQDFFFKNAKILASVSENRMFLKIEFLRLDDKKHVSHVRVFNQLKCGNVCFGQKEIQSYTFFGILLSKIDFGKSCLCFAFGKVFRKIHWCFWPLITQILL